MSAIKRIPVGRRLFIASIQMLQRFTNSRAFRLLMRPFLLVWVWYRLFALVFGAIPKSWTAASPEVAQVVSQLEAARNARAQTDLMSDTDRTLLRTLTWGVAGTSLYILMQIVVEQKFSATLWLTCACFALVVPFLAVLGVVASQYMDSKKTLPTVQEFFNLYAAIYAADLIFCLGFTALLWSYDPRISMLFVVGCWLARRYFKSFAAKQSLRNTTTS
jgi:hypothetical protein